MVANMKRVGRKVVLMGAGVVGGGVVEILAQGCPGLFEITTIFCSNVVKERDFEMPSTAKVTASISDLMDGIAAADVLIDAMGGDSPAWEAMTCAFQNGVHIVSANKSCLANRLKEIDSHFLATNIGKSLLIEAAVAGGVPIIALLRRSMALDDIKWVGGIFNGTTNFILSAMSKHKFGYEKVLKEAQDAGFAEADPSADVDGIDARNKLFLLTRIAFGKTLEVCDVPTQGICKVSSDDFAYAKLCGGTIKLIGESRVCGDSLHSFVSPVILSEEHPLASCHGVMNEVEVGTVNCGRVSCGGPGAGRYPTANSIVSDLMEIADTEAIAHPFNRARHQFKPAAKLISAGYPAGKFYIRVMVEDAIGIVRDVATAFANYGVSIHSILQTPIIDHSKIAFAVITEHAISEKVTECCKELGQLLYVTDEPFMMPYRV